MLWDELLNNDRQKTIPIKCFVDNSEAIKSTKLVADKRLRIEIASIKEMTDKGEMCTITWLCHNDHIPNCLRKRGVSPYYMNNGEMTEKWKELDC